MKLYATLKVKGSDEFVDVYNQAPPVIHKPLQRGKEELEGPIDLVTGDGRPVNKTGETSYLILDMYGDNDIELEST